MRSSTYLGIALGIGSPITFAAACGGDEGSGNQLTGDAGTGGLGAAGTPANAGGTAMGAGGSGTAGTVPNAGGAVGNGGSPSAGGAPTSGGSPNAGGAPNTGGTPNTGGNNGTGGAGPFVPTGDPITAPNLQWTWVDFPNTTCRDGSAGGLAVSLNSASNKVMVYLEGGGACFNATTCGLNPANVASQKGEKTGGLFNRSQAANPVRDWNFVYVPYCTGDVHAGTNDNGTIAGLGAQHFVGRLNIEAFLHRVVPTFPAATQVLLTGISAGGFGAAASADVVQWAFDDIPVTLIDDSGPPMSSQYLPACLQDAWRTTWGLDGSILKDCGSDCPNPSDYVMDFALHLGRKFAARQSGLIETTGDSVITLFYGFGANGCAPAILPTPVPEATFRAGLLDFRTQIGTVAPSFGTYFIPGTTHTWLGGGSLYTQTTGGTAMIDWVTGIVNGTGAPHVGP